MKKTFNTLLIVPAFLFMIACGTNCYTPGGTPGQAYVLVNEQGGNAGIAVADADGNIHHSCGESVGIGQNV